MWNDKMKVTLNIENDKELRVYIKDLIKGQVLSVIREELLEIIKEELERKVKGMTEYNFDRYVKDALMISVSNILYTKHNVDTWNTNFIKPYIDEKLEKVLKDKDWQKEIEKAATLKIQQMLNKQG